MRRIRSFDILRVISFLTIIYFHMVTQLRETGWYTEQALNHWYTIADTHIADPAVAVFFMMSGAVLMISAKNAFSLSGYLKKRFSRLLIPYYLLTIAYFALLLIIYRGETSFFSEGIPAWHAVFNMLGMDGWMLSHGIPSFYLGIGEWFLGALLILSLLFPLFRLAVKKAPLLFLTAASGVYAFFAVRGTPLVNEHISLLMKGYEFILGMYLGVYIDRVPRKAWMAAAPVTAALLLIPAEWAFRLPFRTTLQAAGLMISFTGLEPLLAKHRTKGQNVLSGYGYELFLTHHIVITFLTGKMQSRLNSPVGIAATFLAEAVVMTVMAIALKWASGKVICMVTGGNRSEKQ